jgi:hypothetical protein
LFDFECGQEAIVDFHARPLPARSPTAIGTSQHDAREQIRVKSDDLLG